MSIDIASVVKTQLYFEDLTVGDIFRTPSRTVTESDVAQFAGLSADYNRIHVDDEFAKNSFFGKRIAHGLLVLSMLSGLVTRTIFNQLLEKSGIGLLNLECRFPRPTFIGDTIYGEVEIADKRITSKGDRGVVTLKRRAINQHDEIVVDSEFKMMIVLKEPVAA
ncbi:MaoC/PaaZ C-terminal domain-containing protein [Maricurvus nonylphenolicus]|uniref:MaoC/PaaZ C-terminal domain-containing protein n=1 Tax=Maricurvus nonylphenolicus TaxID=1008307 RepID=UPI0036F2DB3B